MEKKELRAGIHDEGTRVWVNLRGFGRVLRDRAIVLDGEAGEAVGDGDNGRRSLGRDTVGCRHGGLEGRGGGRNQNRAPRRSHKISMPSLKHFILQQRVLHLYRFAIRASRCMTLSLFGCPLTTHNRHTRPTHTGRDTALVSRRDRTQQAPRRHRECINLAAVHVSCSPGCNREPVKRCQQRNPSALCRNQTLMATAFTATKYINQRCVEPNLYTAAMFLHQPGHEGSS